MKPVMLSFGVSKCDFIELVGITHGELEALKEGRTQADVAYFIKVTVSKVLYNY
ncbi:hypothetical protein SAMN03159341_1234 [Paenibacillus sp. 1_12]|nr:hypothetical protein SAMN03159341_1234 [Paenibacillus sp. 1_12]